MDRREHHRAQLRLPVRIRWNTPFGQKTEVCKTLDISRGGLLVPCQETHAPGVPLWVTFPFDDSLGSAQPEMLAKVVSVRPARNGNGHSKERERRNSPRRALAIPVRVRPPHIPWFEEAMTIDISAQGLRFLSSREYQEGDSLLVSFEPATSAPWPTAAETPAQVLRIERIPQSVAQAITISRET